ncbi:MAG: hypothetical protein KY464_07020 [Gemmatimonadetes bacterium]|nr:hypothetical protein [Gemmatimonadota bacterium]
MSAGATTPFERRTLHLLPLALQAEDLSLVSWLGSALAACAGFLPVQDSPLPLDRAWIDHSLGQCSSNLIVDALIERSGGRADEEWTLAITAADLCAPGRQFVFGEAALGGSWAVVSLARLHAADSDEPADIIRSRVLTESLHELGHLAGLAHCEQPGCVMVRAALPTDVDRKDAEFCPACRLSLTIALAPEPHHH